MSSAEEKYSKTNSTFSGVLENISDKKSKSIYNKTIKHAATDIASRFKSGAGLYSAEEVDKIRFEKFSRFGRLLDPYGRVNEGREFLFFVKPDLHICKLDSNDKLLSKLKEQENIQSYLDSDEYKEDIMNGTIAIQKRQENKNIYEKLFTADNFIAQAYKPKSLAEVNSVYDLTKHLYPEPTEELSIKGLKLNPQLYMNNYFDYFLQHNTRVAYELQYSLDRTQPFSHLLSASVNDTLSLDSSTSKTMEISTTLFGNSYHYLQDSEASDNQLSFNLEFVDNKNLDTYHFFKAYNEYHIARKAGLVTPPTLNYYRYKRLHNTMGIYKFVVGEDMETLLYWAYLWGVIPTSCPRDAFSNPQFSDGLTFSISFEAAFIDDMKISILEQFNSLMEQSMGITTDAQRQALTPMPLTLGRQNGSNKNVPTAREVPLINWTLASGARVEIKNKNLDENVTSNNNINFCLKWYE